MSPQFRLGILLAKAALGAMYKEGMGHIPKAPYAFAATAPPITLSTPLRFIGGTEANC